MKTVKILLFWAIFLLPQQSSASWSSVEPGLDFWGVSLTVYDGNLIVGGYFGNPGNVFAPAVASWDGAHWSSLGSGIPRGYPGAMTVYDGRLIIGGSFVDVGGVAGVNHIAQWDGSTWASLGTGLDASVFSLTAYAGRLIAGGVFSQADGQRVNGIAQWDGKSWSPLGSGMDGYVAALTVYNGKLIAAGTFTHVDGIAANNIAQWDGVSWSALGSGITDPTPSVAWGPAVWALTVYDDKLIAGGIFSRADDSEAKNIAQWDGLSWSDVGLGVTAGAIHDGAVGSLAVYDGKLIAAGLFARAGSIPANNIARWDGISWSSLDDGADYGILGLAVFDNSLIAVGAFNAVSGLKTNYIGRWDSRPRGKPNPPEPVVPVPLPSDPQPSISSLVGASTPMADVVGVAKTKSAPQDPSRTTHLSTAGQTISFELTSAGLVSLDIFQPTGARVQRLIEQRPLASGKWQFWWNGRDHRGNAQNAGVYFARLSTVYGVETCKLVYVK